jgi:hypothetical protein
MGMSWSDKAEADLESINPIVKDQLRRNTEVTLPDIMPCRARSTSAMTRSCGIAASPMSRNARQSGSGGKTTMAFRLGTTSFLPAVDPHRIRGPWRPKHSGDGQHLDAEDWGAVRAA